MGTGQDCRYTIITRTIVFQMPYYHNKFKSCASVAELEINSVELGTPTNVSLVGRAMKTCGNVNYQEMSTSTQGSSCQHLFFASTCSAVWLLSEIQAPGLSLSPIQFGIVHFPLRES